MRSRECISGAYRARNRQSEVIASHYFRYYQMSAVSKNNRKQVPADKRQNDQKVERLENKIFKNKSLQYLWWFQADICHTLETSLKHLQAKTLILPHP